MKINSQKSISHFHTLTSVTRFEDLQLPVCVGIDLPVKPCPTRVLVEPANKAAPFLSYPVILHMIK
jgi:hypothetical protein